MKGSIALDIQETVYKGKIRPYGKTKGSLATGSCCREYWRRSWWNGDSN